MNRKKIVVFVFFLFMAMHTHASDPEPWLVINIDPYGMENISPTVDSINQDIQNITVLDIEILPKYIHFPLVNKESGINLLNGACRIIGYPDFYFYLEGNAGFRFIYRTIALKEFYFDLGIHIQARNQSKYTDEVDYFLGSVDTTVEYQLLNSDSKNTHYKLYIGADGYCNFGGSTLDLYGEGYLQYTAHSFDPEDTLNPDKVRKVADFQTKIMYQDIQYYNKEVRVIWSNTILLGEKLFEWLKSRGVFFNNTSLGLSFDYRIVPDAGIDRWSITIRKEI